MSKRNFKEFDGNPRTISKGERKALKDSMAKYGDISGIVWNRRTGQIVGGNQRSKIIDIRTCEITITEDYEKPDKFGTVAIGHVVWNGTQFSYREVDWTRKKEVEANIFANKLGGQWDKDILQRDFKTSKLLEWGFKDIKTGEGLIKEGEVVEFEKSVQLTPQMEYIVIVCRPDSDDFDEIKDILKLQRVRRGGYKEGSAFDSIGLERVVLFEDFKKRWNDSSNTK